ncbi:hypothetical protein AAMO2058_001191000 [Amorphochlora amoebiformis]
MDRKKEVERVGRPEEGRKGKGRESRFFRKTRVKMEVAYNRRDMMLYALGIGCKDLRFIYEHDKHFEVFPTYPLVLGFKGDSSDVVPYPSPPMLASLKTSGIKKKGAVLDGERHLCILKPLPGEGARLYLTSRVVGVHPKKSGTVLESEMTISDKEGDIYAIITTGSFYVGVTDSKPYGKSHSRNVVTPSRKPDSIVEETTSLAQAALYRLSGDYNPLHIDPKKAKELKFPRPILHGLCTMGHSVRHVLQTYGDGQGTRVKSVGVRFSSPVYPGETLITKMWKTPTTEAGNVRIVFETSVKERNKVVMKRCEMVLCPRASRLTSAL